MIVAVHDHKIIKCFTDITAISTNIIIKLKAVL